MRFHDSLCIFAILGYVVASPVIAPESLSAVALARRDIAAPKSLRDAAPKSARDVAAPKSIRDASPKSARDIAAPKSLRDVAAPKSLRDAAPKSARDVAAPKSVRDAAPKSARDVAAPKSVRDAAPKSVRDVAAPKSARDAAPKSARDVAAPKSIRDAAPKSVRDAAPKSVRDAAPKSVRDAAPKSARDVAAPKSLRDAAPKSVRDAAPKSVRDAAPKSAREASPEPEHVSKRDLAAPNSIYVRDNTEISSDHVLRYLKDRSLITWVPSGSGQVADITDALWDIGLSGAARRKRSMAPLKNRKRSIAMLANQDMGELDGLVACYEQEIEISSARLVKAIAEVCQSFAKKSATGTLRIWETTIDGSHIRFGMRVLGSSGSGSDITVCQSTLSKVEQKCKKSGHSSGGQVELGKEFLFTVDPTPFRLGL